MKTTKHILCLVLALLFFAAYAEDTDCGAIITTTTIESTAKVENLTGANAGKATITINNNSGTANAVTVYNSATMDTALSGKASTGDITALQTRATALETATSNLTTAVAAAQSTADGKVSKTGDTMTGTLQFGSADNGVQISSSAIELNDKDGTHTEKLTIDFESISRTVNGVKKEIDIPHASGTMALLATTLSGYGITDAKIANGTITLGGNTITPLTSFTESDPVWTAEKSGYVPTSRKVAGMALTGDITLKNLSIVGSSTTTYNGSATASVNQSTLTEAAKTAGGTSGKTLTLAVASTSRSLGEYYISIGSDGKPHLMLRQ